MKKFKKYIILVLIIVISIISFHIIRNSIIINKLSKKIEPYLEINNYHMTLIFGDYTNYSAKEIFCKDNKFLENNKFLSTYSNDYAYMIRYYNGEDSIMNFYMNDNTMLVSKYNNDKLSPQNFSQIKFFTDITLWNLWDYLEIYFLTFITSEKCNDIDCYKFKTIFDSSIAYFSKETGLLCREKIVYINDENKKIDSYRDLIYEFNAVKDENIECPEITNFTILSDDV